MRRIEKEKFPHQREVMRDVWESLELRDLQETRKKLFRAIMNMDY